MSEVVHVTTQLVPFGSDRVDPQLVLFPLGGGFVAILCFLVRCNVCGARSLSRSNTTCTFSTPVDDDELRLLLD